MLVGLDNSGAITGLRSQGPRLRSSTAPSEDMPSPSDVVSQSSDLPTSMESRMDAIALGSASDEPTRATEGASFRGIHNEPLHRFKVVASQIVSSLAKKRH